MFKSKNRTVRVAVFFFLLEWLAFAAHAEEPKTMDQKLEALEAEILQTEDAGTVSPPIGYQQAKQLEEARNIWQSTGGKHSAIRLLCAGVQPMSSYISRLDSGDIVNLVATGKDPASSPPPDVMNLLGNVLINSDELCASAHEAEMFYSELSVSAFNPFNRSTITDTSSGQTARLSAAAISTSAYANRSFYVRPRYTIFGEGGVGVLDFTNGSAIASATARVAIAFRAKVSDYAYRPHDPEAGLRFLAGGGAESSEASAYGGFLEAAYRHEFSDGEQSQGLGLGEPTKLDVSLSWSSFNSDKGISSDTFGIGVGLLFDFPWAQYCPNCLVDIGGSFGSGRYAAGMVETDRPSASFLAGIEIRTPIEALNFKAGYEYRKSSGIASINSIFSSVETEEHKITVGLVYRQPSRYIKTVNTENVGQVPNFPQSEQSLGSRFWAASSSGSYRGINRLSAFR